jgi:tetratricopeptide (TPR) repeat protein
MKYLVLALMLVVGLSAAQAQAPDARALNEIIVKANAAQAARNWAEAEKLAKQLISMAPERWEYHKTLADAQGNQGRYPDAMASYDRAIALAEKDADAAKAKPTLGVLWAAKGNVFIKLKNNTAAVAAFQKAAALSDKPGLAYFNLCATMYNMGDAKGAAAACGKSIAADPNRADAYFVRGSALFGDATVDAKGKMVVPPASLAALCKYLELAPNGPHANDVKEMLKAAGQPVTTTYQKKK